MSQNKAYIFCIGRELLEGLVLDRNANFMAHKVSEAGCRVRSIQVLDDEEECMVAAFKAALDTKPAYILTTGGLGPGHDDLTRECLAKAAGLKLLPDENARAMVEKSYRRLAAKGVVRDAALTAERLKMAHLPEGAACYENPIGTAPAIRVRVGDTLVFSLPGMPPELQHMFDLYVLPAIKAEGPGAHKEARHIQFGGQDESALTRVLADITRRYPGIHTKARVNDDGAGTRISIFGEHTDRAELDSLLERAEADLRARLGLEVVGRGSSGESGAD